MNAPFVVKNGASVRENGLAHRWCHIQHTPSGAVVIIEDVGGELRIRAVDAVGARLLDMKVSKGPAGMCS